MSSTFGSFIFCSAIGFKCSHDAQYVNITYGLFQDIGVCRNTNLICRTIIDSGQHTRGIIKNAVSLLELLNCLIVTHNMKKL